MSLEDQRVIARSVAERRILARVVLTIGREYDLLAFRAPDTHLHMEPLCDRRGAGQLVRRVGIALHHRLSLPVSFSAPYIKPLADQRHGGHTFWYIMDQDEHHGVNVDPWGEASNLPDLLGLRLIGGDTIRTVRRFLPRVSAGELAERLGVTVDQLYHQPLPSLPPIEALSDAVAAASALPNLQGRRAEVVAARHAGVQALGDEVGTARIAEQLGISAHTVRRLRSRPAEPQLVEAIRRQLRLRVASKTSSLPPMGV